MENTTQPEEWESAALDLLTDWKTPPSTVISFIKTEIRKAEEKAKKDACEIIRTYANYWNPIGDKLNEGKVKACTDLLEALKK